MVREREREREGEREGGREGGRESKSAKYTLCALFCCASVWSWSPLSEREGAALSPRLGHSVVQLVVSAAGKPYITSVYPTEGWTSGGTRVCIVGMNFFEGIEVVFGTLQASAEVSPRPFKLL